MALPRQDAEALPLKDMVTPGATAFAVMFALESMARASLATVIPLQAYVLFGAARDVSLAFLAVAVTGLAGSFAIPLLIRRIGRRWVYPLGGACLVLAPLLFVTETIAGQLGGMLVRVFGTACLNITLNLYIMDFIHKRDLVRSEPRKFLFSAAAWTIGPSLGVLLFYRIGVWAANGFSLFCALLVLANFWRMRLLDDAAVAKATRPQPNPLASIGRFLAQPRLRLAWVIAFGRTCWWGAFMVYAPLLIVRSGADPIFGGLMVSAASAMLFLTPLWGRIGARLGLRRTIIGAFCLAGTATFAAGLAGTLPLLAAVLLMTGALGGTCLDAVGNIPFLRAAHPYERPQMTTVFRTYMDFGDLVTSGAMAAVLTFFDLPAVFIVSGIFTFVLAALARHLPRSM
ncbi:MAG TPA: MFS transporter [Stellaceae bacterium]|jgi:MFS family permease|nr:MFS transporter [Stellaceae bacterium]